jgi:hypothetical protein
MLPHDLAEDYYIDQLTKEEIERKRAGKARLEKIVMKWFIERRTPWYDIVGSRFLPS